MGLQSTSLQNVTNSLKTLNKFLVHTTKYFCFPSPPSSKTKNIQYLETKRQQTKSVYQRRESTKHGRFYVKAKHHEFE